MSNDLIETFAQFDEDDSGDFVQIYTAFIQRAVLEDSDREALKRERGFTDETIDLCQFRSCRPENRELVESLRKDFDDELLVSSGLLVPAEDGLKVCGQLLGTYNKNKEFVNNICIPYLDENQQVFFLRPHKFGFKNMGINIYCPTRKVDKGKTWIITESEFKAAAAIQFGYPAMGLPGIHSFAVNNFPRLVEFIRAHGISKVVIIFDNEIKNDPKLPNYKPDIRKQWDTQWRSVDLCRQLTDYSWHLDIDAKVGVLPDSWMEDGKIDIDGALAQGRTADQFRSVVLGAKPWLVYKEKLPEDAKWLIDRKLYKQHVKNTSPVKKEGNSYYIIKEEKKKDDGREIIIPVEKEVSNFVFKMQKVMIEGDSHVREFVFYGRDGSVSPPHLAKSDIRQLREFSTWAWSRGNYHFYGQQPDLNEILKFEEAMLDGRDILRPNKIGRIESGPDERPIWLFRNCIIDEQSGTISHADEDGVIWCGRVGYLPRSINDRQNKIPELHFSESVRLTIPQIKEVCDKIELLYGTKSVKMAIGFIIASLMSKEIFDRYASFPILFISGKRESGKSTLGRWLMAFAGINKQAGEGIGDTTIAGTVRNLAWNHSLPHWLDEWRNEPEIKKKWETFLRSAYQRQSASKGTTSDVTVTRDINSTIILSGEETPEDNALLSRCVIVDVQERNRKDPEKQKLFHEIDKLCNEGALSSLMLEVIRNKQKLLDVVIRYIDGWKPYLKERGVGDRLALNHAIAACCYFVFFMRHADSKDNTAFIEWLLAETNVAEEEKESGHLLAQFMDDCVTLHEKLVPYYSVYRDEEGKRRIAIHFTSFYNIWAESYRRRGETFFKRTTMLRYLGEESYFVKKNHCRRIKGKQTKCLVLSLEEADKPPSGLLTIAEGITEETTEEKVEDLKKLVDGGDGTLPF